MLHKKVRIGARNDGTAAGRTVRWTECGKQKVITLKTPELAEVFATTKEAELNSHSGAYQSVVPKIWDDFVADYIKHKTNRIDPASIRQIQFSLARFKKITGVRVSTDVTSSLYDDFIEKRLADTKGHDPRPDKKYKPSQVPKGKKPISKETVNKDIRNINALLNWGAKHKPPYCVRDLAAAQLKIKGKKNKKIFSPDENGLKRLFKAIGNDPEYRMRALLGIATGLRNDDLAAIRVCDIDVEKEMIHTFNEKKDTEMADRPLPKSIMPELNMYINNMKDGQVYLFPRRFDYRKWSRIRNKAGMPQLKFHGLRAAFGSILLQQGVPVAVVQELMEHSTPELTTNLYGTTKPRHKADVDKIDVTKWTQ